MGGGGHIRLAEGVIFSILIISTLSNLCWMFLFEVNVFGRTRRGTTLNLPMRRTWQCTVLTSPSRLVLKGGKSKTASQLQFVLTMRVHMLSADA